MATDYERLLKNCLVEYKREIAQTVARRFPSILEAFQAGEIELPIIGRPETYWKPEDWQGLMSRALCAQKWFEFEGPKWAQPLPLTWDDCIARYQDAQRGREYLTGQYGLRLRAHDWYYERAPKFEVFCADQLRPPGFW
jgi:hypothetical protein